MDDDTSQLLPSTMKRNNTTSTECDENKTRYHMTVEPIFAFYCATMIFDVLVDTQFIYSSFAKQYGIGDTTKVSTHIT